MVIFRFSLILPALLYLIFLLQNLDLLSIQQPVKFFFFGEYTIPVVGSITLFFILYIAYILAIYNFSNMYRGMRAKKLEKQVFDLKSKLLDKQSELIKNIETKFTTSADTIKQENDKKLDLYKKENEKVVSQVQYDFETLGKKLDTLIKKK